MSVRVRFAPSPTGYLHIGGARTALFNWLYARHMGGTFVLRIEDTDAARNSQEAVDVILSGLRWLGLEWDEGPTTGDAAGPSKGDRGPYFQSQRGDIYRKRVQELLDKDLAYYDAGAIRFRMQREAIVVPDLVKGDVHRELTDREEENPDFFLIRADGQPIFHFVNVVDDLEMGITHVIRGEDHLSNTTKHIALFRAFGAPVPKYAHIPLILNPNDGTKMSKRDIGASLGTYIQEGYAPEAVLNYLCLLGWSPKDNTEKIPLAEIVKRFDVPQILKHNARFDMQKLEWLSGEYLREMDDTRFHDLSVAALKQSGLPLENFSADYVKAAIATCKGKVKRFAELAGYAGFYFVDEIVYDAEAAAKDLVPEKRNLLVKLHERFAVTEPFNSAGLEAGLKAVATELGVKAGVLVHPCRLACTGKTAGPSLYHLLEILGREKVLHRLDRALAQF